MTGPRARMEGGKVADQTQNQMLFVGVSVM